MANMYKLIKRNWAFLVDEWFESWMPSFCGVVDLNCLAKYAPVFGKEHGGRDPQTKKHVTVNEYFDIVPQFCPGTVEKEPLASGRHAFLLPCPRSNQL